MIRGLSLDSSSGEMKKGQGQALEFLTRCDSKPPLRRAPARPLSSPRCMSPVNTHAPPISAAHGLEYFVLSAAAGISALTVRLADASEIGPPFVPVTPLAQLPVSPTGPAGRSCHTALHLQKHSHLPHSPEPLSRLTPLVILKADPEWDGKYPDALVSVMVQYQRSFDFGS